jgi:5-oxoprolinase (ATP-hydrolysing) subunit A
MIQIDLNADIGEGYGVYEIGDDESILNYISSANIACGFHAGDPKTMRRTVKWAIEKGVAIGAHPGFPDLRGFGRRPMTLTNEEVYDIMVYQIGALQAFAKAEGGYLHHVKPHGALYNMAAKDGNLAEAIARAIYDVDPDLILYGLSGSALILAGEKIGLKVANEAFSDRGYRADGSLVPRSEPGAFIKDADVAADRFIHFIKTGYLKSVEGTDIKLLADTVCLHGDSPGALLLAKRLYKRLAEENIRVAKINPR